MTYRRSVWFGHAALAMAIALPAYGQSGTTSDSGLVIEINLPAFRLDARVGRTMLQSFSIAAGMPAYQTPTRDYLITEVEWNPWWHPPDSWWARNETVTPPGPQNPMGRVKMALGGTKLYLHGTPAPQTIGTASSHACIRLRNEDAIVLAKLVQRYGGGKLTDADADSILSRGRPEVRVKLPSPVPVQIVYRLVELRGDDLVFHPDVYRRGREHLEAEALALIAAAGYDTIGVDRALLARTASDGKRSLASVSIWKLLLPDTAVQQSGIP